MSLQLTKPKLSRTSTHKARTGCITCKRRHVKCDEAKPHCANCLRSRGHCEGYAADQPKKASGPVQLRWDSTQAAPPPMPPLRVDLDSLDFRDATSMLYFQEFVGLVQGPWTTASSSGDLWGLTLPQLARKSDTLRHAAIAIGALSIWHQQSKDKSLRSVSVPALPAAEGDAHYFHALDNYCHSLKLQSRRASVQDAVFLSVLSLFFETLRGNRKAALDHVNHGLAMLLTLLTDGNVADFSPHPKPVLGAVADIFTHLGPQARIILRNRLGQGPPLPHLTKRLRDKKQTMESFLVLLSTLPTSPDSTIDTIPPTFTTLDEFELHFSAARRRQTSLSPLMVDVMKTTGILTTQDPTHLNTFYATLLSHPQIRAFCATTRALMHRLDAAFLPLFHATLLAHPPDAPAYLRAIHLRLAFLAVHVFEDPPQYLRIADLTARTAFFREFLSLADIALRAAVRVVANPAHRLSLQCGIAWNLLIVAFFCRDPLARDEAVAMLRDYPGQDGLWDTRALYVLALRNRVLERANAQEGDAEEQWRRLWRREFVFEEGGERIVFRYLEKAEGGEWRLVEEVAEVRGVAEEVEWVRRRPAGSGGLLMTDLQAADF